MDLPVRTSPKSCSLQRHTTAEYAVARRESHLPSELLERIIPTWGSSIDISQACGLRLVCRSFAVGLLPFIVREKIVDVFLDDQGIEEIEEAVKMGLAPFIQHLRIGVRRIGHYGTVFRQRGRFYEPHGSFNQSGERETQQKQAAEEFVAMFTNTNVKSTAMWSILLQKARVLGFDIIEEALGCRSLPRCQNYTPNQEIIARLAGILYHFSSVQSLESREHVTHRMVVIRAAKAPFNILASLVVKVQHLGSFQPHVKALCMCDEDVPSWNYGRFGSCDNVRSMSRSFFFDLPELHNSMTANSPMLQTLKEFRMDLPSDLTPVSMTATGSTPEIDGMASMLHDCINLKCLVLWTQEPDENDTAGHIVEEILKNLTKNGWKASLTSLQLSSVNPCSSAVIDFLSQPSCRDSLEYLRMKNCGHYNNAGNELNKLWEQLQRMTNLSFLLEGFITMPSALPHGTSSRTDWYVVDASAAPGFLKQALAHAELGPHEATWR